jgi:hypothetical protein|tara:strand:- start:1527 stop:1775 length:249 start_codon:yes stop_codon:yes gene_type:complete
MNAKVEILLEQHIERLKRDIADRNQSSFNGIRQNPWHSELDKADLKNIASLREGRIPIYGDHMNMDNDIEMSEFDDLTEAMR